MSRAVAWLGLGSNLDAPARQLERALDAFDRDAAIEVLAVSHFYRTTPVGGPPEQPLFCNVCVALAFDTPVFDLLARTQAIEQAQGRVRDVRWGPRTLDIDLLAVAAPHGALRMRCERLTLPHPLAAARAFVLVPLTEIAPALELGVGERVADLARRVDSGGVARWNGA